MLVPKGRARRRASQRSARVSSAHHGDPREFVREASARRARRSARSRAPGSCLPVAQSNRLKYLAPLNVRMSLSFGSRRRALQRPAASSMSDADSRARVLTTTPPRRLRSARATSRPPPPPHATPPGASRSPFSDTHRVCGGRGFVSLSREKPSFKKAFSPPRPFAGPRRPCRTSCLTRQTHTLTHPDAPTKHIHTETAASWLRSRSRSTPPPRGGPANGSRPRRSPRRRSFRSGGSEPPRSPPRTSWRCPRWATPSRRAPSPPC